MNAGVLFITYDGLMDQLGGSQILPYVESIAEHQQAVTILSFEKSAHVDLDAKLRSRLHGKSINWKALRFTRHGGKLGKAWDLARMYLTAIYIVWRNRDIRVIHCRSYLAAQVGCLLKKLFGVSVIFDMRGLWPDERLDGGLWNLSKAVDRIAYRGFKCLERKLLLCADSIVTLTARSVPELHRLSPESKAPIVVIPCCADYEAFVPYNRQQRDHTRAMLGLRSDDLVLSYLGSLGTWYLFDEMLAFFVQTLKSHSNARWLVITRDWTEREDAKVWTTGGDDLRQRIVVRSAERSEVPVLLASSDVMLSFIKPAYSKLASSPTKLAEAFALGIPTISSSGVGDVDRLVQDLAAGAVVDLQSPDHIADVINSIPEIANLGGAELRQRSRGQLGLEVAVKRYREIYETLDINSTPSL